ncbi:unnamed protein product, partial [Effrenium voratum]
MPISLGLGKEGIWAAAGHADATVNAHPDVQPEEEPEKPIPAAAVPPEAEDASKTKKRKARAKVKPAKACAQISPSKPLTGHAGGFFQISRSTDSPPPKTTEPAEVTPEKTAMEQSDKEATPEQQKELAGLRQSIQQAVKLKLYGKAKLLHHRLLARCREIGCAVPRASQPAAGRKGNRKEKPGKTPKDEDAGNEPEGEPMDRISFARGILQEKFPLQFPQDAAEDDSEIIPNERWDVVASSRKRKEEAEDEHEEEDGQTEAQELKKALSSIPDASYEDIDRFPAVAATFKQWLQKQKRLQDDAENAVKVLYDLFLQDEKSLDAMAKAPYLKAVAKEPSHESSIKLFASFWTKHKGPWSLVERIERKAEVRMRIRHAIPESWALRIVQRAHKEDLVILTSPQGGKHFEEASKFAELPALQSEDFARERQRQAEMDKTERERLELDRLAKAKAEKGDREKARITKASAEVVQVVKDMMTGTEDARDAALRAVLRQHFGCRSCGRLRSRAIESAREADGWSTYDDVPNATEEDIEQYPRVLVTYYQQGYPYMTGVRRLMELYKKKAWHMASAEFQRLVRMDPENARCNGFLNSAILYLRKFRENGGFDQLLDTSDMDPVKLQSIFTPDFERESCKVQENFDDLQVEVPLELVMADATSKWRSELQEKLDDDGYLLEDVDARGQRPVALSVALLPNATDQEWGLWPRILAKYESYCKQESEEEKPIRREAEANDLFLAMKELVEHHGKSPDAMASRKYLKIVRATYSGSCANKDRAAALAKFGDFWAAHKDTEFPEPKVHTMAALKYKLIDRQLLEKAKKLASDWQLPEGWAVKLGKDGRLMKVTGPGKMEIYHSKEAALQAVEAKAKRQAEEAKAAHQQMISAKETNLQKQLAKAVQEENYELAEELQKKAAGSAELQPSRPGAMQIVARCAKELGKKRGVKNYALKRQAKEAKTPKARKALGLRHEQKQQVARSELTLRAGEWRLQGVRANGELWPLSADALEALGSEAAVLVLVYVDEEVRDRKRRRIIEDWGLDDTWTVTVRYRLSGDQVTAKRADGNVFLSKHEVACAHDREAIEKIRPAAAQRVK